MIGVSKQICPVLGIPCPLPKTNPSCSLRQPELIREVAIYLSFMTRRRNSGEAWQSPQFICGRYICTVINSAVRSGYTP